MCFQENGQVCAVGSSDGCVTILKLSRALYEVQPNEKRVITAVAMLLLIAACLMPAILASNPTMPRSVYSCFVTMIPNVLITKIWKFSEYICDSCDCQN